MIDVEDLAARLRHLTPAERARRAQLIAESGLVEGMARFRRERARGRTTMSDRQFGRLLEALTARQAVGQIPPPAAPVPPAAPAAQPLTLTPEALAKLSGDELAALGAQAWAAYGDQEMSSPFWRAA